MLSVLVAHAYFLRFDGKQFERAKPYPPLATLQVAAMLRQDGHAVAFFDAMLAEGPAAFARQLRQVQPRVVLFYEDNFNYLSKMCLGRMRQAALEMIAQASACGARVIVAGSDVSDAPEVYLRAGAELALLGEGLAALQRLLPRLDADSGIELRALVDDVPGVATWQDGQLHTLRGERAPAAFDESPAWDLVDVDSYRRIWHRAHGSFSLNMAASRGCSFRCAWCAKPIWGKRYVQRAPAAVAAEMGRLKRTFGPDHVWFADDIFGMRADWVDAFAAALRADDAALPFTIQTRADLVSPAMARALAAAGCSEVWIGAESGSQRILDAMDKGTTVDEILGARARLKAQGVRVGFFIQLGYLGEQLADLLATRALIERAQPDAIGVSVAYPLPGTRFHEQVKAQLGDKTHWDDSGDLAMMFQGSYDSAFYRQWRELLHAQVEVPTSAEARLALQIRWDSLLAGEARHRNRRRIAVLAA
jgi:anaerobic magnesium-protoporphyrin IX monomethyl ester cyclase